MRLKVDAKPQKALEEDLVCLLLQRRNVMRFDKR